MTTSNTRNKRVLQDGAQARRQALMNSLQARVHLARCNGTSLPSRPSIGRRLLWACH